ncbi:MAG TPA: hypothetical protein VF266_27620 [Thermoanaerobaculia bacterium]
MRLITVLILALPLHAQVSGFALLRGATEEDRASAQVQVGFDWRPSMALGGHVHVLARSDEDGSHRGRAGIVEAWLDQKIERGAHRLRFMEGAFFLPGTRENVDALWESPYTISSSALSSWLGEEFRPVGVDASYTLRRRWTIGATAYSGNDTFGALPAVRGWRLHDRWTLLGEHVPVDDEYFTSVSAETDHRVGWAARGRWNNDRVTLQLMRIDNRSDALEYGDLLNWLTRFDIASADLTLGDWTLIAESGQGFTDVIVHGERFRTQISTSYVLVSRRLANGRVSLRAETFDNDFGSEHAVTAAYFWSPGKMRLGAEAVVIGTDPRLTLELRYYF